MSFHRPASHHHPAHVRAAPNLLHHEQLLEYHSRHQGQPRPGSGALLPRLRHFSRFLLVLFYFLPTAVGGISRFHFASSFAWPLAVVLFESFFGHHTSHDLPRNDLRACSYKFQKTSFFFGHNLAFFNSAICAMRPSPQPCVTVITHALRLVACTVSCIFVHAFCDLALMTMSAPLTCLLAALSILCLSHSASSTSLWSSSTPFTSTVPFCDAPFPCTPWMYSLTLVLAPFRASSIAAASNSISTAALAARRPSAVLTSSAPSLSSGVLPPVAVARLFFHRVLGVFITQVTTRSDFFPFFPSSLPLFFILVVIQNNARPLGALRLFSGFPWLSTVLPRGGIRYSGSSSQYLFNVHCLCLTLSLGHHLLSNEHTLLLPLWSLGLLPSSGAAFTSTMCGSVPSPILMATRLFSTFTDSATYPHVRLRAWS
ncbi:hypothetical protein PAPYR_9258 [Paratrimastix pyriformis]|uniref:Uncharacterized protein n=1 Tax=Paratrimastix pyriformis TaxID=342808 RepID=A0ABQ8U8Y0_9EUKA|nr:hypothetical protein PAPYR_9258 [Paratrimastix pyriformis]